MSNKELAASFDLLAKLMDLHKENPFKIRSYKTVAGFLNKLGEPAADMDTETLLELKGVGKAIADKIQQLVNTGKMSTLERYREMTPPGIVDLLGLKGIGTGKVRTVWKELGVESAAELLYACEENRLVELKGFGPKSQADILEKLHFHQQNKGQLLYWKALEVAADIEAWLYSLEEVVQCKKAGNILRKLPVIAEWEFVAEANQRDLLAVLNEQAVVSDLTSSSGDCQFKFRDQFWVNVYTSTSESFDPKLLENIATTDGVKIDQQNQNEIPAHMRELAAVSNVEVKDVVVKDDLKGVLHVHSTYSDGVDSIENLAKYAISQGFEYLGLTDHSQIAVYANGLNTNRLQDQWQEIERLNEELSPFKIFKGIECDILSSGDLDYDPEIRAKFDFIIASIHTNIKMDATKATERMLRAIRDPMTTIVGHPTGRLLLGRSGYPLDMERVLDACAEANVAIELNCSPSRMDLDWSWLIPAQERGVKIAINPDAHAKEAIDYLDFGVEVAQKGWLKRSNCLNVMGTDEFDKYIKGG